MHPGSRKYLMPLMMFLTDKNNRTWIIFKEIKCGKENVEPNKIKPTKYNPCIKYPQRVWKVHGINWWGNLLWEKIPNSITSIQKILHSLLTL